jgi:uncharacterized protein YjiS (DUF1127 family)
MSTNTAFWGATSSQSHGFFARLAAPFLDARAKRRTVTALAELDDYALVDIGIDPADVRRSHRAVTDWVVQSHSGTARLVFIGR